MKPVRLEAWSADWARQAALRCAELRAWPVEHIGSTAVPGLSAKPVIDLLLGLPALEALQPAALEALGYEYRPAYEDAIPQRRYFVKPAWGGDLRVHLHAVVQGGPLWRQHLGFRDRLRGDALLRQRYEALKQQLASAHADDKAAYQAGKDPFIEAVLQAL